MRFLFVSKISKMSENKISGQVIFGHREPWQRMSASSGARISSSVVSESIGQLVSWLSLRNNDFTARPVFLFATRIELNDEVLPGTTVNLEAEITNQSSDSFVFSGLAKIAERTIVRIEDCGGYLMPLTELEDPSVTRARFQSISGAGLPENPGSEPFLYCSLIDSVIEQDLTEKIIIAKRFTGQEPFYADHFPRFPVTPIVIINEMIAEATAKLLGIADSASLKPIAVQDLKIKSFIRPGDVAEVSVKKIEASGAEFETIAEIHVNGRRILRGRYRYEQPVILRPNGPKDLNQKTNRI